MQPEQQSPQSVPQVPTAVPQQPVSVPQPIQEPAPAPAVVPQPPVNDTVVTEELQQNPEEISSDGTIQWQAPEYMQDRRSPWWFIGFWAITAIVMVLAAFVVKSISFAVLVPVMAAALMIYSHRPPREITYILSDKGLYINEKLHSLGEFRSFGVNQEEALPSLVLIPTKRFRPAVTVHFPAEYGEQIVDLLGAHIPMEELRFDVFDRLIQKLHL